ncbi:threonine--tRNA ligase, mitochondrial 1 [Tanacetum coccineum]
MEGSSSSDLAAVLGFRIILLVKRSTWSVRHLCNETGEIALGDMPSGVAGNMFPNTSGFSSFNCVVLDQLQGEICSTFSSRYFLKSERGLNDDHFDAIVSGAKNVVTEKQPFERIEVSRKNALKMFSDNKLRSLATYQKTRQSQASTAYWRENKDRESLQRVYGISYPDQKALKDDAHIFCRESQIKKEVKSVLEFISYAYVVFSFTFDLKLSTDAKWTRFVIGQNE